MHVYQIIAAYTPHGHNNAVQHTTNLVAASMAQAIDAYARAHNGRHIKQALDIGPALLAGGLHEAEPTDPMAEALARAIENAGLDISPCGDCGEPVACIPDGLSPRCERCAAALN